MHVKIMTTVTNIFIIFVLLVSSIIFSTNNADATESDRGSANTVERTDFCKEKLDTCIVDADDDCDGNEKCLDSEVTTCNNTWGSSSTCKTRARVGGFGAGALINNSTVLKADGENKSRNNLPAIKLPALQNNTKIKNTNKSNASTPKARPVTNNLPRSKPIIKKKSITAPKSARCTKYRKGKSKCIFGGKAYICDVKKHTRCVILNNKFNRK